MNNDHPNRDVPPSRKHRLDGAADRSAGHRHLHKISQGDEGATKPELSLPAVGDHEVLDAMARHGGGFVSSLAEAWRRADHQNFARPKAAFPEYWEQYAKVAADLRRRGKGGVA